MELDIFEVDLQKTSQGLGLSIAGFEENRPDGKGIRHMQHVGPVLKSFVLYQKMHYVRFSSENVHDICGYF